MCHFSARKFYKLGSEGVKTIVESAKCVGVPPLKCYDVTLINQTRAKNLTAAVSNGPFVG